LLLLLPDPTRRPEQFFIFFSYLAAQAAWTMRLLQWMRWDRVWLVSWNWSYDCWRYFILQRRRLRKFFRSTKLKKLKLPWTLANRTSYSLLAGSMPDM
jgi:hypothetical protein